MPPAKLGGGCPSHALSHRSLNHLLLQPLADPTFGATTGAELAMPARNHQVLQEHGFNFNPVRPTIKCLSQRQLAGRPYNLTAPLTD